MTHFELFPRNQIVGIFRGFREGGLEFHADLILPYRNEFQSIPMHGQFLLVQLETQQEAVLGRIASLASDGKLSSGYGEEFNLRALHDNREVPEDLREEYLKYRVNIRVLGVVRQKDNDLTFVPSHRRLPHVGSRVAFPSASVLQEIVRHNINGAAIGHFALGEYIYSGNNSDIEEADWMHLLSPETLVRFPVQSLIARRSFIFARAGFGKSNLNKLLFSILYEETPKTPKYLKEVPVGTIIFDPDGEYFWPDDQGRPGLCDVPHLQDKLVVFTSRRGPSPFYNSFVAGGIKLDVRRLSPSDVISIALSPDKQDQQNVRKLKGLDQKSWETLVNLIDRDGNQADLEEINRILRLEQTQQSEALAARANMTTVVRSLHDKSSQLMDMLLYALSQGKLCIIDISQMRGSQSLILSGLILRRIFDHNLEEFTKSDPKTIPTIAVIEEAQSVLSEKATASEPYLTWVKEGRKYDLGSLLITQQPGSIPVEILSQGDNWFIFHLLSSTDLTNVQKANAHFSNDILSVLLNEPIPGQGIYWSSATPKQYPIPIRVKSFEKKFLAHDLSHNKSGVDTFARQLKAKFHKTLRALLEYEPELVILNANEELSQNGENGSESEDADIYELYKKHAVEALKRNRELINQLRGEGKPWGVVLGFIESQLPDTIEEHERNKIANTCVKEALESIAGSQNEGWYTVKKQKPNGKLVTWIQIGKKPSLFDELL